MSSNNIASISNLINSEEDEDRKFLRAAAEAIVATSMNNEIDPTILELLRRIQYANAPSNGGGNNTATPSSSSSNPLQQNNNSTRTSNHINFLDTASNLNPAKNSHHFPTFNLNYFESLAEQQEPHQGVPTTTTTGAATSSLTTVPGASTTSQHQHQQLQDPASTSSWSITNSQQTPTPNSQTSTPPSARNSNSNGSGSILGEVKPFICNDCSLSFRRSSDLRRHQRAHLPILPHICKMCGKGFARKDALKRHSDTLTCKRNREKLLSSGGDVETILAEAKKQGHDV